MEFTQIKCIYYYKHEQIQAENFFKNMFKSSSHLISAINFIFRSMNIMYSINSFHVWILLKQISFTITLLFFKRMFYYTFLHKQNVSQIRIILLVKLTAANCVMEFWYSFHFGKPNLTKLNISSYLYVKNELLLWQLKWTATKPGCQNRSYAFVM